MEITFWSSSGSVAISGKDLSISLKVRNPCSLDKLINFLTLSVISFLRACGSTDFLALAASLAVVLVELFWEKFFDTLAVDFFVVPEAYTFGCSSF